MADHEPCVIELNDAGISIVDRGGLLARSPGYAFVDGDELLVGDQAAMRVRTNPRAGFDSFWSHLDRQPLTRAGGPARDHADLAYFHLRALWQSLPGPRGPAVLVVPDDLDEQQLALLLGIADACGIAVSALVPAAVAAAAALPEPCNCLVLDARLHRMTVTRVDANGDLQLGTVRRPGDSGLVALYDTWLQALAGESLAQTRFDPRNSAASEQRMFDALPGWLQTLCEREHAGLSLDAGAHVHRIEIARSTLVEAAAGFYRPLLAAAAEAGERAVIVRERLESLPGLAPALAEQCRRLVAVDTTELGRVLLDRPEPFAAHDSEERPYLATLGAATGTAAAYRPGRRAAPTHLLHRGIAYPLTTQGVSLASGAQPGPHAGAALIRPCDDGQVRLECPDGVEAQVVRAAGGDDDGLAAGDRIWLGAEHFQLIAVRQADEA